MIRLRGIFAWLFPAHLFVCWFGGDSSSSSTTNQTYEDRRNITNNSTTNSTYSPTTNTSNSWTDGRVSNTTSSYAYRGSDTSTVDSGNSIDSGNSWWRGGDSTTNYRGGDTVTSDSGNTLTSYRGGDTANSGNSWWQGGDTSTYLRQGDTSTSSTDARTFASTDSHALSNSGNSSTVINWTGTDAGAQHLADMQTQFASRVTLGSLDAASLFAGIAGHIGDTSAHLAEVTAANSMIASTHMLDLTGELIDRLSTGAQSLVASQSAAGQAAASVIASANQNAAAVTKQAGAATDALKTQVLAGLVVVAIVAFFRK